MVTVPHEKPWRILTGDCRAQLATLPECSADCCVTSPPYWGLRDYGVDGQVGQEATPEEYVATLVEVFREVRRVLRDDATLWLNLGDTYATGAGPSRIAGGKKFGKANELVETGNFPRQQPNRRPLAGLKPKDMVGIPWRVAFALQADGWWLRSDIIWEKPNQMPESVTDRPTKAHEYVFLLSKSESYRYDAVAIAEPAVSGARGSTFTNGKTGANGLGRVSELPRKDAETRNARTVWTLPTVPFLDAHFATFPEELARRCIMAGSPVGGAVLDPFSGAATTGVVAVKNSRTYVGCELNPAYVEMSERRLESECPSLLFAMLAKEHAS